jgi:nucleoside-diphosphate-sugar epimerase
LGVSLEDSCAISNKNLTYEKADITDYKKIGHIFDKYDIKSVIHLAAIVHKNSENQPDDSYYDVNYKASRNIFEQCIKKQCEKLLFASTIEVYGETKEKTIDEAFECNPRSIYGKTKLLAEKFLISAAGGKLNYAIMRFAPVYADNFKLNINKRIYIIPGKLAYYFKKGDYFFNFCSVNNIADFISEALKKPNFKSGIYNLSDSKNYNVKDIISLEKRYNNLKWVVALPYHICSALIFLYEKTFYKILKRGSDISVYNFGKLFRENIYSNMKAREILKNFKWDIINTLYQ